MRPIINTSFYQRNKYETYIILTTLICFLLNPILFNYSDGIVIGTVGIEVLYPHYSLLYPMIGRSFVFLTNSFCLAFKTISFLQLTLCCLVLIHAIRSVPLSKKRLATFLLLAYTPIMIFQLNIMSEGLFFCAQILLLSTIYRLFYKHDYTTKNVGLHILAATILLYTKHIGILFGGILPLIFLIKLYKEKQIKWLQKCIQISTAYALIFVSSILVNFFASEFLKTTHVSLYGRPAMHIITEAYRLLDNEDEKEKFKTLWADNASQEDELILQNFILSSGNIWFEPREQFYEYVDAKYLKWSKQEKYDYVEQSLNSTYWNYLTSGNPYVIKNLLSNFWNLLPVLGNHSISTLLVSHESFFDNGLNYSNDFHNCDFNHAFKKGNLFWLEAIYANLEKLTHLFIWCFLLWFTFFYKGLRKLDEFAISILVFILVFTLANTLFTAPLPRYSIPSFIALLFVVIACFPEEYTFRRGLFKRKN